MNFDLNKETLDKIFTSDFMKKHTDFTSFDDFLKAIGGLTPLGNLGEILENSDDKISKLTKFSTWKEMLAAATSDSLQETVENKLGDALKKGIGSFFK